MVQSCVARFYGRQIAEVGVVTALAARRVHAAARASSTEHVLDVGILVLVLVVNADDWRPGAATGGVHRDDTVRVLDVEDGAVVVGALVARVRSCSELDLRSDLLYAQ